MGTTAGARAESCPAATPACMKTAPTRRPRRCSRWACQCWASATACKPWRISSAARSRAADSADFPSPEGHGMLEVWMSHGDKVTELPPGFTLMASTDSCPIAGMADEKRRFYAVQFHPEVTHTVQGRALLERFVLGICGARPDWVMRDHIAEALVQIRQQVRAEQVILGLSRGRDSSP